jgi:hypothetical protein
MGVGVGRRAVIDTRVISLCGPRASHRQYSTIACWAQHEDRAVTLLVMPTEVGIHVFAAIRVDVG